MRERGMKTLVAHLLDYAFGSDKVSLDSLAMIPQGALHTDHDGFVIDVTVTA
jgi:hypothetical protein